MELLIAITLTAMVVLVLSMVLRTGFQSWSRSKERNRYLVAQSAVESLLSKQLKASFMLFAPSQKGKAMPFGGPKTISNIIPHGIDGFEGTEHSLVFFTTHVPMGSATGGLFKVAYMFDPDQNRLIYAQKIITTSEDYEADPPEGRSKEKGNEWITDDGWLVNVVDAVAGMIFSYKDQEGENKGSDPASWDKEFKEAKMVPEAVGVGWSRSQGTDAELHWTIIYANPFPAILEGGAQ